MSVGNQHFLVLLTSLRCCLGLEFLLLLLAGCGSSPDPAARSTGQQQESQQQQQAAAKPAAGNGAVGQRQVALFVPGMNQQLQIL